MPEALMEFALSPPLRRARRPLTAPAAFTAIVFSAESPVSPQAIHEVYPLLLDAAAAGAPALAVSSGWISPSGLIQRAISLDSSMLPIESALSAPAAPSSAWFVHLDPRREGQEHAELETRLAPARALNSWASAGQIADKAWLMELWRQAGVETPACHSLPSLGAGAALDFLSALHARGAREIVLKPRWGTEGRAVQRASWKHASELASLAGHCLQSAAAEPMLLCEARDGLLWKGRPLCLRLNVSWNGSKAQAESGFVQLGLPGAAAASRGRGGSILGLDELCADLKPEGAAWRSWIGLAEAGMAAIAAVLKDGCPAMLGMDLAVDEAMKGVLLEANLRPGGMSYCRAAGRSGPGHRAHVASGIWAYAPR